MSLTQVKNAIIVCCLRIFMIVCCVSMDEEFEDPDLEQKPKNVQPSPVELRERVFERGHQAESDKGHQAASNKIEKSGKDNEPSKKAEEGEKPKIDEGKEPVNKDGMSERVG